MPNVDATKIHQGPGKLWLGASVPTSGSRLIINAAGEPTAGTPVFAGATEGAATVVLAPKLESVTADQVGGPIDVVMTGEAASIEVTLKESDLAKLKYFIVHGSFSSGTDTGLPQGSQAYEEISFGGVMAIPKTSVAVISARRDAASKYVVSQLYQAYQAEAIQLPFQRGKETTYKVKFEGLADASRAIRWGKSIARRRKGSCQVLVVNGKRMLTTHEKQQHGEKEPHCHSGRLESGGARGAR